MDLRFKRLRRFVITNLVGLIVGGVLGYYLTSLVIKGNSIAVMATTPLVDGLTIMNGGTFEQWFLLVFLMLTGAFVGGLIQQWVRGRI